MNINSILYQECKGVAIITLNCPDSLNALNKSLRRELREVLIKVAERREVRVVVLTGAGRGFCAGASLPIDYQQDYKSIEEQIITEYKPIISLLSDMPKLVIAAVNGVAAGIGTALVMSCDLVVMSEDSYLYQAFNAIGLNPDGGVSWQLLLALGYRKAMEVLVNADKISAEKCVSWGLANKVVSSESLLEETLLWARKLAKGAPLSQQYTKKLLSQVLSLSLSEAIDMEAKLQNTCIESSDHLEAVNAFSQKRPPCFVGE